MNTKNLFTSVAAVCLLFGITLALMPDYIGDKYLADPGMINLGTRLVAQSYGSSLIAIAVALGYAREAGPSVARKGLLFFVLLSNLALIVINTLGILNGVETPAAWLTVGISVIFTVWSGMLLAQQENRAASMG
ncbi:hypothetical protein [Persicitalea sp.]|uniref:hypothetical protein n=1 Tax=Persicitalea sp. TaxID=3100273 RepID=UPI0035934467